MSMKNPLFYPLQTHTELELTLFIAGYAVRCLETFSRLQDNKYQGVKDYD